MEDLMHRQRLLAAVLAGLLTLGVAACDDEPDAGPQPLDTGADAGATGDGFDEADVEVTPDVEPPDENG
jgi:hypothetical protein